MLMKQRFAAIWIGRKHIGRRRIDLRRALLIAALCLSACSKGEPTANSAPTEPNTNAEAQTALHLSMKRVERFFTPMGTPSPFDWLASHKEPGQTFDEYIAERPTKPSKERSKIYILPLGKFTPRQLKAIDVTAGYLSAFYGLPVEHLPAKRLSVPAAEMRESTDKNSRQAKTGYILNDILRPALPTDAAALIAFTDIDLYPDESMSYVFGQASFENPVGVWSLYRLGSGADAGTFLRRTLKIAAHETGHMFSMKHCTKYECVMSGTNSLAETDRRPIDACPECMAKICWLSETSPAKRYERLAEFCRKNGLIKDADDFAKKAAAAAG